MKTRILVRELKNGNKIYIPEVKENWACSWKFISYNSNNYYFSSSWEYLEYYDLEEAKKCIDNYIIQYKSEEEKEVIKSTYIKYP